MQLMSEFGHQRRIPLSPLCCFGQPPTTLRIRNAPLGASLSQSQLHDGEPNQQPSLAGDLSHTVATLLASLGPARGLDGTRRLSSTLRAFINNLVQARARLEWLT